MKRNKIRYILLSMVALFSLSACEIETHDNDKLDGFWHLERVDTIATGGVCDMSTSYSIYRFAKPTKYELAGIDFFQSTIPFIFMIQMESRLWYV